MYGRIDPDCVQFIHDYATCQRPDGSTYGTRGTCRKGVQIDRLETGLFSIKDQDGNRVGTIMAEDALTGGGGIRSGGRASRYTVLLGDRKKEGLTLKNAKDQAKEWLGEKKASPASTPSKKLSPAKIKNIKRDMEEFKSDFDDAKRKYESEKSKNGASPEAQRLLKRLKFLKERWNELNDVLKSQGES